MFKAQHYRADGFDSSISAFSHNFHVFCQAATEWIWINSLLLLLVFVPQWRHADTVEQQAVRICSKLTAECFLYSSETTGVKK